MTEQMTTPTTDVTPRKGASGKLTAGAILILIGALLLAAQYMSFDGALVPGALGLIFLVWGLLTRSTGLLIPGGVLTSIGAGAYLIEGPFASLNDPAKGGLFLLIFAAGWALISLLASLVAEHKFVWWPLIPGGIMAAIGGLLFLGETGLNILEKVGFGWPFILIAIGLYLVLRRNAGKE